MHRLERDNRRVENVNRRQLEGEDGVDLGRNKGGEWLEIGGF